MPAAKKATKKSASKKKAPEAAPKKNKAASDVYNILAALRRPFKDRDSVWPVRRRIRNREEEPPVPEAYAGTSLRHRSGELDFMVRQIVALLSENKEQYIVYAPEETEEYNRLSDEAQKSISSLMEFLEDVHPIERHRLLIHDYQVADGVGIEKISFNWDFFSRMNMSEGDDKDWQQSFEEYVKENRELPIRRTVVDPLSCYWEFDTDGLVAVAEEGLARRSALADTYKDDIHILNAIEKIPVMENTQDENNATIGGISAAGFNYSDPGDLVKVYEVWTRKEFMYVAEAPNGEKTALIRQKHPFKRPPYFFAAGVLTGSPNPLNKFKPLVAQMYQTTQELSMIRTARYNGAYLSSFKPFYVQYDGPAADQAAESGGLQMGFLMPGQEVPSLKGGKIVQLDWTNLEDLQMVEASVMGDRDRFGFQAILAGGPQASGDSTAWETRMLRDQGMIQFNQVLRNYAQMREEEIYFIFDLVRRVLKNDMPILTKAYNSATRRNHTKVSYITTKMAEAGFAFQVRLSAGKASDRIAIAEEFRRGHEAGEIPMRMVLEEGWGFQNVSEIMDEVTDEMVRQQAIPKIIETSVQVAIVGALDELRALLPEQTTPSPEQISADQAAAAQAMQAGAMQPGQPPGGEIPGGIAEPGMGQGLAPQNIPPEQPTTVPMVQ